MGGRGSGGGNSPLSKIENQEYQYHATRGTSVFSIYEQGLKPNKGHAGTGVYFAPTEKDALEWTETSSTGGKTLLRVKTSALKSKYAWGVLDSLESTADKKIASKDIEIRTNSGKWLSMEEYVQKYNNSYRRWKSSRKEK